MLHIIDDEAVVRDSLSWLAASRGIAAHTYDSAQTFLSEVCAQCQFDPQGDCLLLDVRMPDMNGVAVFDQLVGLDLTQRLPVIFLTGHGDVPMAVDSLKRGAFDFFEKPFNDNELMDRVVQGLATRSTIMLQAEAKAASSAPAAAKPAAKGGKKK